MDENLFNFFQILSETFTFFAYAEKKGRRKSAAPPFAALGGFTDRRHPARAYRPLRARPCSCRFRHRESTSSLCVPFLSSFLGLRARFRALLRALGAAFAARSALALRALGRSFFAVLHAFSPYFVSNGKRISTCPLPDLHSGHTCHASFAVARYPHSAHTHSVGLSRL